MIKECKKCGSKNLYLEPRIKGQDISTADMVALKCKDCGSWLKWCPKNERASYLKIQDDLGQIGQDIKWQKLKEWLEYRTAENGVFDNYDSLAVEDNLILDKMKELEAEDVED